MGPHIPQIGAQSSQLSPNTGIWAASQKPYERPRAKRGSWLNALYGLQTSGLGFRASAGLRAWGLGLGA